MRKFLGSLLLAGLAVIVAITIRIAPGPTGRGRGIDDIVRDLRATGLEGRELADEAIRTVAAAVPYHSVWHLWEDADRAVRNGRGWGHQYNAALVRVLRELGFRAKLVHAARVQGFEYPWYMSGHTWAKVMIDGYWLDACAATTDNYTGRVSFVPVTDELPRFTRTVLAEGLALTPMVLFNIWRALLTGTPVPDWVYHRTEDE